MKILITGAAGFIGFHISKRLMNQGLEVIGLDSLNNYYDINLKADRLKILKEFWNPHANCLTVIFRMILAKCIEVAVDCTSLVI